MCCEISDVLLPVECRMATGSSSWTSFTTEALFICKKKYQLSGCLPLLYTCRLACWPSCSSPSQAWCPSTTYGGTNGTSSSSRCRSEHVHSLGKTSVMHRLGDFMLRIWPPVSLSCYYFYYYLTFQHGSNAQLGSSVPCGWFYVCI